MSVDCHGNQVTGASPRALEHYATAVQQFALYVGDPVASLAKAATESPTFAMATSPTGICISPGPTRPA